MRVGEPNDVFSFGVVAWECLTIDRPWRDCTDVIQVPMGWMPQNDIQASLP